MLCCMQHWTFILFMMQQNSIVLCDGEDNLNKHYLMSNEYVYQSKPQIIQLNYSIYADAFKKDIFIESVQIEDQTITSQ
ncbi:unnamed protein product [Paramecium sonneborni]|uniref:Uncharacterized protein n=1 Tax=Paramecium sonneborni TaxID=65129 RepID=A0A8S1Q220_9CILI|nr:unnamed protein product [Paramecium sonneborni]